MDEAQHLKLPAIEELRSLSDPDIVTGTPGNGVCLIGNSEVFDRIRGKAQAEFAPVSYTHLFALHKRNKADDYLSTVGRDMVAEEASILFERQRELGCAWATPELQAEYLSILLRQRSFDEGPGGDSPYGGNQVEKMVDVYKRQLRASTFISES